MSLRSSVNRTLKKTTGYELVRDQHAVRAEVRQRVEQRAKRRLQAVKKQHRAEVAKLEKRLERLKSRPSKEFIPSYVDQSTRDIIARCKPRTLTGTEKLLPMVDAVRYVARHEVPGAIVEAGVWRGGSMQAMAWTLMDEGVTDRDLYLYDTFEGMSEPTEDDVRTRTKDTAADLLAAGQAWCIADFDDVRQGMEESGYPIERVHMFKGKVEETIPANMPDRIAVLRLDTDWYESTKHELEHLYPLLVPGGVLIIDDFGSWDGARKAVLEWMDKTGEQLLLVPIGAARIAIKQG